jgi:hypothetical protein
MGPERWFSLTLALLAAWRVTHLLVMEDGPGDVIVNIRMRLGDGFFGKLMDCFYCMSLWVAAPFAWLMMNAWRDWPLLWLAISGAACLLERISDRATGSQATPPPEN